MVGEVNGGGEESQDGERELGGKGERQRKRGGEKETPDRNRNSTREASIASIDHHHGHSGPPSGINLIPHLLPAPFPLTTQPSCSRKPPSSSPHHPHPHHQSHRPPFVISDNDQLTDEKR